MYTKIVNISVNRIDNLKAFVSANNEFDGTIEIHSEPWVINGKSIMGLYSLDLEKVLEVHVRAVTLDSVESLLAKYAELNLVA